MRGPDIHILGGYARRGTALILCAVVLAACTLPMPVKIASWALDGIAYVATNKSVTDHGISLVAQQDCALWRGFMGEQICQSDDGTAIAVAVAEGQPAGNAEGGYSSDAWTLVALELGAGPTDPDAAAFWAADESCGGYGECRQGEGRPEQPPDLVLARRPAVVQRRRDPWPASEATHVAAIESPFPPHQALTEPYDEAAGSPPPAATAAGDTPGAPGTVDHVQPAATADRPAPRRERVPAAMVGPGLYYVIGSFSQWNNAQRLAARHGTLTPSVVTGKLDGRKVFRVVIGPFGPSEQEDMRALIHRAGHYDAWAVRMNSTEWSVARSTGTARNQVYATAQLTKPLGV